jgi:hypothetical protein
MKYLNIKFVRITVQAELRFSRRKKDPFRGTALSERD